MRKLVIIIFSVLIAFLQNLIADENLNHLREIRLENRHFENHDCFLEARDNSNNKISPNIKMESSKDTTYLLSDVIIIKSQDTLRYSYTYDINGNELTELVEDWVNEDWVNKYRMRYEYDGNGKLVTDFDEIWLDDTWIIISRSSYMYDGNGNRLTELVEYWGGDVWNNGFRFLYTYDGNGNMITAVREDWVYDTWENSYSVTYTYNENGNMLTQLYEDIDIVTRSSFTYDENGNVLTEVVEYLKNDAWLNSYRRSQTYDGNGYVLTRLIQYWQNDAWGNHTRSSYTYDGNGNELTELGEYWYNSAWEITTRHLYTYDGNGNLLLHLREDWENDEWVDDWKGTWAYDENGNCIFTAKYEWTGGSWELTDFVDGVIFFNMGTDTYSYYGKTATASYIEFTSVENDLILVDNFKLYQNYPNPFNPETSIEFSVPNDSDVKLSIFNVSGQLVKELINNKIAKGNHTVTFNAEHLNSGVYFYKLSSNNKSETRKMIFLK